MSGSHLHVNLSRKSHTRRLSRKSGRIPSNSHVNTLTLIFFYSNIFHSFPPSQTQIRLSEITDHLLSVTNWCDANKITINIKKTNFMIIQPRRKVVNTDGSVELKDCTLNKVDTTPWAHCIKLLPEKKLAKSENSGKHDLPLTLP